jgi:membrane-bound ClpP family serine protease
MPSGRAKIDGKRIDVIAEAGPIEADTEISVVAVKGPSVIVRK